MKPRKASRCSSTCKQTTAYSICAPRPGERRRLSSAPQAPAAQSSRRTGTRTLARHPEIRWRLQPPQLAEFHTLQISLLRSALQQLAPGGHLVYSTCSMETEENEQVVAEALRGTTGLKRNVGNELARGLNDKLIPGRDEKTLFDRDGYFRTTPDTLETDGFFAAIISKS